MKLLKRLTVGVALGFVLALTACSQGCASISGARHTATVSVVTAHTVLGALQDGEMGLVCGRTTAPTPPACVDAELHKRISGYLAEAFEYDVKVATLVRDVPTGAPTPSEVISLISKISELVNKILSALPKSPQQEALQTKLVGK